VGDQKRDVEAAGEEAGMQQQVAAVAERLAQGRRQTLVGLLDSTGWRHRQRAGDPPHQWQRRQGHRRQDPHRAHPAERLDRLLEDRSKDELPKGTAGIDHSRRRAARFQRQALRSGADQHGKAPGT
jgi:hypothetical protein